MCTIKDGGRQVSEIKKCECGYFHIYKKSWIPFIKPKPLKYLYRELFCLAWVNRSFNTEGDARFYISGLASDTFLQRGEYAKGVMENICQQLQNAAD